MKYKYMTFQGGGIACIAEAGVVQAFEEAGLMHKMLGFGGTSGGSAVAALCADLKSASQIQQLLDTDFHDFLRDYFGVVIEAAGDLHRLLHESGLNSGRRMTAWIDNVLQGKMFKDLPKQLEVFAVPYERLPWSVVRFSASTSPYVKVSDAVRASSGIPILFTPKEINSVKYIDGGVLANNPAKHVSFPPDQTINVRLTPVETSEMSGGLGYFIHKLSDGLVGAAQDEFEPGNPNEIWVDRGDVEATDFNISGLVKQELMLSGYRTAKKWIAERDLS